MTLSPIPKVLSTFLKHKVKALLIGGQACILYGAAEFSRDIDLAIVQDTRIARFFSWKISQNCLPDIHK